MLSQRLKIVGNSLLVIVTLSLAPVQQIHAFNFTITGKNILTGVVAMGLLGAGYLLYRDSQDREVARNNEIDRLVPEENNQQQVKAFIQSERTKDFWRIGFPAGIVSGFILGTGALLFALRNAFTREDRILMGIAALFGPATQATCHNQ